MGWWSDRWDGLKGAVSKGFSYTPLGAIFSIFSSFGGSSNFMGFEMDNTQIIIIVVVIIVIIAILLYLWYLNKEGRL